MWPAGHSLPMTVLDVCAPTSSQNRSGAYFVGGRAEHAALLELEPQPVYIHTLIQMETNKLHGHVGAVLNPVYFGGHPSDAFPEPSSLLMELLSNQLRQPDATRLQNMGGC